MAATTDPPLDREIERKYLLEGLPDTAAAAPSVEIVQGYLPGTKIVERIRRVRQAGNTRFVRTIKLGKGVSRIEIEESMTEQLFDALWPLTEGRRIRKRRYRVPDGNLTWEEKSIGDALLKHGALNTIELRRQSKLAARGAKSRFDSALASMQRGLWVIPIGISEAGAWKYAFR
ncbi:MAG: hypothetical protein IIA27_16220, partial [Gemmatimonadetes bacterium]|nr:hypothetical protein [Gemmatimonadota bacterium]